MWPSTGNTITKRRPWRSDLKILAGEKKSLARRHHQCHADIIFVMPIANIIIVRKMNSPWAKDERSDNGGKSHDGGDVDVQNCGLLLYQYLGLMIMTILLNDY